MNYSSTMFALYCAIENCIDSIAARIEHRSRTPTSCIIHLSRLFRTSLPFLSLFVIRSNRDHDTRSFVRSFVSSTIVGDERNARIICSKLSAALVHENESKSIFSPHKQRAEIGSVISFLFDFQFFSMSEIDAKVENRTKISKRIR